MKRVRSAAALARARTDGELAPPSATIPNWDAFVLRGRKAVVPGRAPYSFADSRWYVPNTHTPVAGRSQALSFEPLPRWLQHAARQRLAHLWLKEGARLGVLSQTLCALKALGRALPHYIGQPHSLGSAEARRIRKSLEAEYTSGRLRGHTAHDRVKRIKAFVMWLRLESDDAPTSRFTLELGPPVPSRRELEKPLAQSPTKFVPAQTLQSLLDACAEEELDYRRAAEALASLTEASGTRVNVARAQLTITRERAIKAQLIKLAVCVGRRAISLCSLPANVAVDKTTVEGHPGVWVRLRETKIRGVDEDVFCPYVWGDIASDAISKARAWAAESRSIASSSSTLLFVARQWGKGRQPYTLSPELLNRYLRSLITRRRVKCGDQLAVITTHNFRTTLATKLVAGGMSAHDLSRYLGHFGSPDMAINSYVADIAGVKDIIERELAAGAAAGDVFELTRGRPVAIERLNSSTLQWYREHGVVYNPTMYGACALPTDGSVCVTANPCWLGRGENHEPRSTSACACEYAVLTPHGLSAMRHDGDVLSAQIQAYSGDPQYAHWVSHLSGNLERLQAHIAEAEHNQKKLETADAPVEVRWGVPDA